MSNRVELSIAERFPFAGGHEFGAVGAYERLVGRAHFAVDPHAPAQQGITDIDKAPVDAEGLVRFTGDFSILKPVDSGRGNRRIFFDYGNRGNKRMLQFFNDAPASNDPRSLEHAGNGFLMRRGYTVVWLAWQGDLLSGNGRMVLDLPVAPVTGPVRVEYIADRPGITTFPLSGHASTRSHPAASLDPREARLTRRRYPDDQRIPVRPESWRFARVEGGVGLDNQGAEHAVIPSDTHIHIPAGFEPGWIYELVYTGRDPLVLGLGHAAVRDLVSFLRYAAKGRAGLGAIEKAYAWGRSQTGRCIRDFVYRGFNADAAGRKVFDGILPHVAGAGRKWLNHRFANAVVSGGQQYEDHFNPADTFPFSYAESTDHLTGRRDAILKRPETDPLVIHTQTATEYWQRRGSLVHTDTRGNDLPATAHRAGLFLGQLAAFRRPDPETAGARHPPAFSQYGRDLDAVPRSDRRDGPLGDGRHRGARQPHPAVRRRYAGPVQGMAPAIPGDPRRGRPPRAQFAAVIGFRPRSGAWDPQRAA
jgi:hypothetical protein